MSNCALNFLKGLWSFILGSLRMIFFFGCLIFLLIQMGLFVMLISRSPGDRTVVLPGTTPQPSDFAHLVFILGLSLLGAYGAFYKHIKSIKLYALLSALSTAILIVTMLYGFNSSFPEENTIFLGKMAKLMPHYDIDRRYGMSEANRKWDELQHLFCCGLKGPQDWYDLYGSYPYSCCFPPVGPSETCNARNGLIETGCAYRIEQIHGISVAISFIYIGIQLILCLIACIVANFQITDRQQACARTTTNAPQEYQRFEGSIYVRQPPINEAYTPSHIEANKNVTNYYPNASHVERPNHTPPPGYNA